MQAAKSDVATDIAKAASDVASDVLWLGMRLGMSKSDVATDVAMATSDVVRSTPQGGAGGRDVACDVA